MSDSKEFALLAEKTLPWRVKPDLVAYCPTMDILALATREERVYMYRLNGQRVLTATNKDHSLEVNKMHWKPDGAVRLSTGHLPFNHLCWLTLRDRPIDRYSLE